MPNREGATIPIPCNSLSGGGSFGFDLNATVAMNISFVWLVARLVNCTWGIFSDRPARLLVTFDAWVLLHSAAQKDRGICRPLTRGIGCDQGILATVLNRHGNYVQTKGVSNTAVLTVTGKNHS